MSTYEESFLKKAKKKHNDKYDYTKIIYKNSRTKVEIVCKKHGSFWQTPSSHLRVKVGCPACTNSYTKKLTKEEFIVRAIKVHKNKFDYSKVNYINSKTKVCIICKEHGDFFQNPGEHLSGRIGCKKCWRLKSSNSQKMNLKDFLKKCNLKHNYYYDYSKVVYKTALKKISIICPKHGEFQQVASAHMRGAGCNKCSEVKRHKSKTYTNNEFLSLSQIAHDDKYDYPQVYSGCRKKIKILCKKHNFEFEQMPYLHLQGKGCPKCALKSSKYEDCVRKLLRKYNFYYQERNREIIKPLELDFYIPNKKIAIECNGLFWHSDLAGKDNNYHINKTELCENIGIKLIHIFSHEFDNQSQIVNSRLKSLLGLKKKKYARKCNLVCLSKQDVNTFYDKYHLQSGNNHCNLNYGLEFNNKLLCCMSFCESRKFLDKKLENTYELLRFAGNFNTTVIGGFSKLLKHFQHQFPSCSIISYCDRRWSNGDVYNKCGFKLKHKSKPNYWYFNNKTQKIYHRFSFRKQILHKKLNKFDKNKTEWENMKENGWNRFWDCGNLVYEISV